MINSDIYRSKYHFWKNFIYRSIFDLHISVNISYSILTDICLHIPTKIKNWRWCITKLKFITDWLSSPDSQAGLPLKRKDSLPSRHSGFESHSTHFFRIQKVLKISKRDDPDSCRNRDYAYQISRALAYGRIFGSIQVCTQNFLWF